MYAERPDAVHRRPGLSCRLNAATTEHVYPDVRTSTIRRTAQDAYHAVSGRGIALRRDQGFDVSTAYDDHVGALYGFALNALDDRFLAEDCVQEVFIRAWRAADRYDPGRASVRTWLFAIARRVVIDVYRARQRRPAPAQLTAAPEIPDPADEFDSRLTRLVVYQALATLSPSHREVIVEVQMCGVGYAELAARTGVPVATLRTRMYHGLRALRAALEEIGGVR